MTNNPNLFRITVCSLLAVSMGALIDTIVRNMTVASEADPLSTILITVVFVAGASFAVAHVFPIIPLRNWWSRDVSWFVTFSLAGVGMITTPLIRYFAG